MRNYFEAEMHLLHEEAQKFSENYPLLASKLNLRELKDKDPHVERLLEGCAFLTAQLRQQIDAYAPDISETLLTVLCPQLLYNYPSATIIQFSAQCRQLQKSIVIDKNTCIYSECVGEEAVPCCFRTTASVLLHPLAITEVQTNISPQAGSIIRLKFNTENGLVCNSLELNDLSLYLNTNAVMALQLYLILVNQVNKVSIAFPSVDSYTRFDLGCQEMVTPQFLNIHENFSAFQLLQDYFHFRERYFFININGLQKIKWPESCREFVIEIHSKTIFAEEFILSKDMFQLHCVPAVNLYEKASEPILFKQQHYEYPLIVDLAHRDSECLYKINEVVGLSTDKGVKKAFYPLTSFKNNQSQQNFYKTTIKFLGGLYPQTYLNIGGEKLSDNQMLSCKVTVCNGYYPRRHLQENTINKLESGQPMFIKVKNLSRPTAFLMSPQCPNYQWQLIAYLTTNYESLAKLENLQQLLQLYDWSNLEDNKRRILSIKNLEAININEIYKGMLLHGLELKLSLQEEGFNSCGDIFLFGQILHEFFTAQAAINSFIQTRVICYPSQREFLWKPRYGKNLTI
ncbi:type VI secretion system baseplate subunit TssF [soil metagenome]